MDFSYLINLLILLFPFIIIALGWLLKEKEPIRREEEGEEDAKSTLQAFLKSLDEDEEEQKVYFKKPPPPPAKGKYVDKKLVKEVARQQASAIKTHEDTKKQMAKADVARAGVDAERVERYSGSSVVSKHYENMAVATPYEVTKKEKASRAANLIHLLKSKRDMVILNEILSKPLAMRPKR